MFGAALFGWNVKFFVCVILFTYEQKENIDNPLRIHADCLCLRFTGGLGDKRTAALRNLDSAPHKTRLNLADRDSGPVNRNSGSAHASSNNLSHCQLQR